MSTVRLRRLTADSENLRDYVKRHPRLQLVKTDGDPPERYQIEFQILGLRQKDDELIEIRSHLVEISLPLGYPKTAPQCRMLTPIFHPNIAPQAICIGDHWSPGEPLTSIVARIGELISYQSYNTKSPLNGEAARWVNEHLDEVPLDAVSMVLDDPSAVPKPRPIPPRPVAPKPQPRVATVVDPPPSTPTPSTEANDLSMICSGCAAKIRFKPIHAGKRIRCPRCQAIVNLPIA